MFHAATPASASAADCTASKRMACAFVGLYFLICVSAIAIQWPGGVSVPGPSSQKKAMSRSFCPSLFTVFSTCSSWST